MAFDSAALRAVGLELNNRISQGRITKIYQSLNGEVTLFIRGMRETLQLLISANPSSPRIYLTQSQRESLKVPPNFCMVLRKYIEGGKIISVEPVLFERILRIKVESRNEIGNSAHYTILAEIMGKHSNIILLDEDERIIDCLKHIGSSLSRYRELLPGRPYILPPHQNRKDPLILTESEIHSLLEQAEPEWTLDKTFTSLFMGMSPLLLKELFYRAGVSASTNWQEMNVENKKQVVASFRAMMQEIASGNFTLTVFTDLKGNQDFSVYPVYHVISGEKQLFTSVNAMLDHFYSRSLQDKLFSNRRRELMKVVEDHLARIAKRLEKQTESLLSEEELEELRVKGELLFAHLHLIPAGVQKISLPNFYDPENREIQIGLNPHHSVAKNAQQYFKQYNKGRNALTAFKEQELKAKVSQDYLNSLLVSLQAAEDMEDLQMIETEMADEGYLRVQKKRKEKKQEVPQNYLTFVSPDGFTILAGKNNRQNEMLSLKVAKDDDWWFHTKDIPGSHVIVRCPSAELPPPTLRAAACIAAFLSKARESSQVPVDYTLCKYVRKAKGLPPGMVIYDHQKTVFVTPDPELIAELTQEKNEAP